MSFETTNNDRPTKKARKSRTVKDDLTATVLSDSTPKIGSVEKGKTKHSKSSKHNGKRKETSSGTRENGNGNSKIDKSISERTKRSWETRRAKSAQIALDPVGPSKSPSITIIPQMQTLPLETPLPTSEFLLSLHRYASEFYTSNGLMFEPLKKGRQVPWGSKKRLMIIQDSGMDYSSKSSSSLNLSITSFNSNPNSRSKSRSRSHQRSNGKDHVSMSQDGDSDELHESEEEGQEDDDDIHHIKQEGLVDEYGELILDTTRPKGRGKSNEKIERKERSKGKYKKRDMFKSIEGDGLMALGMVLQEHIIKSIHIAGYTKPLPRDTLSETAAPTTPATHTKTKSMHRKSKKKPKTKKSSTQSSDQEEELRDIESEEGQDPDND
ncbi:uncharacterized protein L201_000274 [Kwoniella dendrophila CBS 6074]|uniref:Uncharacterized protein n=1 Tax=Kwoniella dendrophila CBS 6074 TaxID=1295534 RepID=A0AAX4JIX9_9TREE